MHAAAVDPKFTFVRLKGGRVIEIEGAARGRDGRADIPGKRLLDKNSAGEVAGEGAGTAASEIAAEIAGNAVGSQTLRKIGQKTGEKAREIAKDEDVIVAKRNVAFDVYVEALLKKKR